ncbi:MAG: hypothetical protein GSR81_00030 [Desulfurococcales archaeon]|nr:hypothetical protein [Desulfurococcales archaeon]
MARDKRLRRKGQGEAITLMILVSATLVLALMLYAYFSGIFSARQQEQIIADIVASYTTGIRSQVIYSAENTTSGTYLYCTMITLSNMGGDTMRPYISVVPGTPGGPLLNLSSNVYRVPIDYTVNPPLRDVYVFVADDIDEDGVVELIGSSAGGLVVASENIVPCQTIYANATIKANDYKPIIITGDTVTLDLATGFKYSELVSEKTSVDPGTVVLPLWSFLMNPAEELTLYIYIESPVPLSDISLLVLAQVNNQYYLASALLFYSG